MISTFRGWIAKLLSTEVGVLGARLDEQGAVLREISEDYSSFKERVQRHMNKTGMRWARSGANGGGEDINDLVLQALRARKGPQDPFQEM